VTSRAWSQRRSSHTADAARSNVADNPSMLIDSVCPEMVEAKSDLTACLITQATARGLRTEQITRLLSIVPQPLSEAGAFLDKLTGIWRYEFGVPYQLGDSLVWGTHMWEEVSHLLDAMLCVLCRVPEGKRLAYLRLLSTPSKHPQTLVEMIPATKVDENVAVDFEVGGLGNGNRTVDWVFSPHGGRTVLCDVKRRTRDFLEQFERLDDSPVAPEPNHDPALLFRNVEHKFRSGDPDEYLQGAWIVTDIAQEENRLLDAFRALDPTKVHFAILGDWLSDAHVLVRREQDGPYLRDLFRIAASSRFVFNNES
jgi:hypothetical protein